MPHTFLREIQEILSDLGIHGQVQAYGLESDGKKNNYHILLNVSESREDEIRSALQEAYT